MARSPARERPCISKTCSSAWNARWSCGALGRVVFAALLEAECVHREHCVVSRRGWRQLGENLGGAIAHRLRLAEVIVEHLRDPQRDEIVRIASQDGVVAC